MALKLLAGPFPLRTLEGNYCRFFQRPMWFDQLQAFAAPMYVNGGGGGDTILAGMLTQLDGTVLNRNDFAGNHSVYSHDIGLSGISVSSSYSSGYHKRGVDWLTLSSDEASIVTPLQLVWGDTLLLGDRALIIHTGSDIYWRPYGTATYTLETTLPAFDAASGGNYAWTPGPTANRTAFIAGANKAFLYDHVAKQVVGWERRLDWNSRYPMIYSPQLGVWFAFDQVSSPETHDRVWIYADAPEPSSLSNPAASGTTAQGKVITFTTRLTGALGEPCEGYLVDWSVTTGPGVLLDAQSTTDADGYASARVGLPLGTAGQTTTVHAEVLF